MAIIPGYVVLVSFIDCVENVCQGSISRLANNVQLVQRISTK